MANSVSNARLQLTLDAANTDLLDYLESLPSGSTVYVNLPRTNEYYYEIRLHLVAIRGRPDVSVVPMEALPEASNGSILVTPVIENQFLPSVRCGADENSARYWNRALAAESLSRVHEIRRELGVLDIGLDRLVCAATRGRAGLFCNVSRPLLFAKTFAYGWLVYRVAGRPQNTSQASPVAASARRRSGSAR